MGESDHVDTVEDGGGEFERAERQEITGNQKAAKTMGGDHRPSHVQRELPVLQDGGSLTVQLTERGVVGCDPVRNLTG